jgi:hypothetical protein
LLASAQQLKSILECVSSDTTSLGTRH